MKRILIIVLLVLLLCVSGCATAKDRDIVLEDVYQAVIDIQTNTEPLIMFPESSPEVMEAYYPGITSITMDQQVYYLAPVMGFASEIFLVEVSDMDDVEAVKEIFQKRIDMAADDTLYPETAVLWLNNAEVHVEGRYVCMIVLPDGYEIPKNVFELVE